MHHSRRSFIATAGIGAASLAAGAFGGWRDDTTKPQVGGKGGAASGGAEWSARPVVGAGSTRFEVFHDWLSPPARGAFGDTHGVAQDSAGNIYLAHTVHPSSTLRDAVYVYSKDGTFLRSFGAEFAGGAHGLDLRSEGGAEFLYHCDTGRRKVVKTRLDGTVVWSADCPMQSGAYEKPEQWCPTNVAFGPDGLLFVGDGYGASFIHAYDADGNWKRIVARPGKEPGQVSCPHGMTVDTRGTAFTKEPSLAVADRGNRRIQYLSLDGKHLGFVTTGMRMPCDMKVRGDRLLVPDLESVVTILDGANAPVAQLCDGNPTNLRGASRDQFIAGKFVHPHDAIWLANGDILVAEWVPIGRVTLLRSVPA